MQNINCYLNYCHYFLIELTILRIGSAEIASKELNRNFIGIEIDKDYYNIAQERINNTKYNEVI